MFFTKSEKVDITLRNIDTRHRPLLEGDPSCLVPVAFCLVLVLFFTIYVNTIGLINIHYDDELDLILIMLTNL